jgi:glycosyltransferase involved in cell wall biosynthesis
VRVAIAIAGTDRGKSGIGVWVREVVPRLVSRLSARGEQVILLGSRADLDAYAFDGVEQRALPDLVDAPMPSALFHAAAAQRVARLAGADVLLLPAANRRFALGGSVPTVAVVHDLAPLSVRGKYDALRTLYLRALTEWGLGRASRLVAVSRSTAQDVTRYTGVTNVQVVENGVDAHRFRPRDASDPEVQRARTAHGLDRPYVLYVSRLEHPGKNHVRLIRAFAETHAARRHDLVLAGGDWGAGALIAEAARAAGVQDRVRILGRVEDEHLPGMVAGADALAMVGLAEGFGLPALEGLAAGRPVLAARAGALPEVVGSLGVLADPLSHDSLREGLARVLDDTEVRARAASQGPAYAAARDWGTTADGVLRALDEVTAPHALRAIEEVAA